MGKEGNKERKWRKKRNKRKKKSMGTRKVKGKVFPSAAYSSVKSSVVISVTVEGGRGIEARAKYGSKRKAAILLSEVEPSTSASIYDPPEVLRTTTKGPKYRGWDFRLWLVSIREFRTRTRAPSWKL